MITARSEQMFEETQTDNKAMRKVVFVETADGMGGVQFSTLNLAQHLDPEVWKPVVVCSTEGDFTKTCRRAGIETHVLGHPKLRSISFRIANDVRLPNPLAWFWDLAVALFAALRLARFLSQLEPDLVVTKGLFPHLYGGLAARQARIPCIWHVQDLVSERTFGIYRRALGVGASWLPDQIIVDGGSIERQLPRSLKSRVTVIHNGIDTAKFRPGLDGNSVRRELNLPLDNLVVGTVGRITPWKGQHYLIEAFARIAERYPNVCLLVAGAPVFDNDTYQRGLQNLVTKFGLQDRIRFAGYRHDLPNVLAAMDVFAFTSIEKDTSPLALLSAMSAGLPIVAFDIEGVRELMTSDQCLLTQVGSVEGLAASLGTLLEDPARRRGLGISARGVVVNKLSLDLFTSRTEEVFLKLLGNAPVVVDEHGYGGTRLVDVQN